MPEQPTIQDVFNEYPADLILYRGEINRLGYHRFCDLIGGSQEKKEKLCLVLITHGGDPNAAYRIARAAKHHYHRMEVFIPDVCKSAGTLLCIGADGLIFGDRGEMGPLDIQVSKPDEIRENMSGLNIFQAISALTENALGAFSRYLAEIKTGGRIRTRLAADFSATLASHIISPIAAQIDPLTLGEHNRAMQIALEYGKRLADAKQSLQPGALTRLLSGYPSHEFVIDRREARTLFNHVSSPQGIQVELDKIIRTLFCQSYLLPGLCEIDRLKQIETTGGNDGRRSEHDEVGGGA